MQGSRVHITLERLDLSMLSLSVHSRSYESPEVEPSFDKVWVLGQGVGNSRGCLRRSLYIMLSRLAFAEGLHQQHQTHAAVDLEELTSSWWIRLG
jgi:hypothetical protein